ncbi:MAG: hemolysin family protein [Bacteroidales bacterium]|nr:hemolysin family protein [Bacteroidales bacterium]
MDTTYIIYILISLVFSAFFSGVEIAFVSSNKVRYELDKNKKGISSRILSVFYKNYEQFISTMLVGNNIALVIYGILMAKLLEPLFAKVWDNEAFIVFTQTVTSTLIILVTAEFLPKTIFKISSNFWLKFFAIPLWLIYYFLYPISVFVTFLSKAILRVFGLKLIKDGKHGLLTKVDLDFFIQQSIDEKSDVVPTDPEVILFQNALDFSSLKVRDCMIPRTEMTAISNDASVQMLMEMFIDSGHSKIVVYHDNIDNVVGYIHSSEMFKRPEDWRSKIKPIPLVTETMAVNKLLKQLLDKKRSIAVVIDEFGGTAGVITMEDIVEEIFGDFEDEHDTNTNIARKIGENEYEISGRMEIEKLNEMFDLDIPESDEYVTLAGFILNYYQEIPKLNDEIEIGNFIFKIIKIATAKIELVKMKILH